MSVKSMTIASGQLLAAILLHPITSAAIASELVAPNQVLSSITADWNNDGNFDRAVLVDSGHKNGADLYIYLSNKEKMELFTHKPGFAWQGSMWGMQPQLSRNRQGALRIHTENTGIGRQAWNQIVTLDWRNDKFIVAGYNYDSYDRLDPANAIRCDLNLLNGKGQKNGKTINTPVTKIPLQQWNETVLQQICCAKY